MAIEASPVDLAGHTPLLPDVELDTAGELVSRHVPRAAPGDRVADVRDRLVGQLWDSAEDIAVTDGDHLVGLIRISDLLAADGDQTAAEVMDADPPIVTAGVDQEVVAWKAVNHGEASVAVVDADGRFVGVIPPWRMLRVLLEEHDEDVARLGGFLRSASSALAASEESIARRFWHRLPWLLLGLAGSVVAASIVAQYEEEVARNVILAFFLPGIVYMADAVGTQTEALVIRGLSVGIGIGHVIVREIFTGLLMGIALAGAFMPVVLIGWARVDVAVAVALSLFLACAVATTVALTFPLLLDKLGKDPAFGSGPLATVVQDLLSIVIYFVVAGIIV